MIARSLAFAVVLALPGAASAQAYSCAVPAVLPPVHPELTDERNPQRLLPIGGYTLAVTWAPEYCHGHAREPSAEFECGRGGEGARFGFSLHGLWPDGIGPQWPQYCRSTPLLPPATIRRNLCSTPSAQLMQHEWAKHGTCMGATPDAYFAKSTGLYARIAWPDMASLARSPITVGALAQAIARGNPGIGPDMMRITANKNGWLDEIWFCLDRRFAYTRCKVGTGGEQLSATIRIAPPQ